MQLLTHILLLMSVIYRVSATFYTTVDAYAEDCYFETLEKHTKMGLTFKIAEGGFLDIDIKVIGPDGKIIHEEEQTDEGKYTFSAYATGDYKYCFNNQKSTMTPKRIMFSTDISAPKSENEEKHETENAEDGADHTKLEDMIGDLKNSLWGVKNEQEYMQLRDRTHSAINESTNFRVVLWSIFEATVLISMTLGQVFYLKRFFEVRRVV